jgi:hypothetical protein
MTIKISKEKQVENDLPVEQLLDQAHELEASAIHGIYALKPVALTKLQAMLDSKDSRTVLQASRLILEFGNS